MGGYKIGYRFRSFEIPEYMMEGLERYIKEHLEPGSFLLAVLSNDLSEAVSRADDNNQRNLPAYVGYLYNKAPSVCWGSPEKVKAWLEKREE